MSSRKKRPQAAGVFLTERALSDIRALESHSTETWGRRTAEKYLDDIEAALDRLRQNPEILRMEPAFAPGLYFYRVRKHLLACDVRGDSIIVLTAIHASMEIPARLAELQPRLIAEAKLLHEKLRGKSKLP